METVSLETPDYPKKSGINIDIKQVGNITEENPFSVLKALKQ